MLAPVANAPPGPAMTLRAATVEPPISVPFVSQTSMPLLEVRGARVEVASTPIQLPWIVVPVVGRSSSMPSLLLPM